VIGGAARPGSRRGLPPGVMVFALLDDFVNMKDLHIQHDGKNPCHPQAAPTAHTAERYLQAQANQQSAVI